MITLRPCHVAGGLHPIPKASSGFTLIELLVVFTMLGLLLSIAVPRYLTAVDNSKEKVRLQNMATIRDALDKFNADQGRYPNELMELVEKKYLKKIPVDPVVETEHWTTIKDSEGLGIADIAPPDADSLVMNPPAPNSEELSNASPKPVINAGTAVRQ